MARHRQTRTVRKTRVYSDTTYLAGMMTLTTVSIVICWMLGCNVMRGSNGLVVSLPAHTWTIPESLIYTATLVLQAATMFALVRFARHYWHNYRSIWIELSRWVLLAAAFSSAILAFAIPVFALQEIIRTPNTVFFANMMIVMIGWAVSFYQYVEYGGGGER